MGAAPRFQRASPTRIVRLAPSTAFYSLPAHPARASAGEKNLQISPAICCHVL
jgi:hypothetical protein